MHRDPHTSHPCPLSTLTMVSASWNESGRIQASSSNSKSPPRAPSASSTSTRTTTSSIRIDIENNATAIDSEDDDPAESYRRRNRKAPATPNDVTCFSPACCSRFEALTGLDIHAIKRELEANRHDTREEHQQTLSPRSTFEGGPDHKELHRIEQKAMALNRVDGPDELFVGGIFALRRPGSMEAKGITTILSMIKYSFVDWQGFEDHYVHLSVDIDDVEDEDILVHLPRAVRFVDRGLKGGKGEWPSGTVLPGSRSKANVTADVNPGSETNSQEGQRRASLPETQLRDLSLQDATKADPTKPSAVFVHCAMGKSRSVTAVLAFLLWKYPHRYGLTPSNSRRPDEATAHTAVQGALDWVRKTREIAEPNPGFMHQLEMWVMMGMPTDADNAVERHGTYQRWIWEREVKDSANLGRKPDWFRFEDEVGDQGRKGDDEANAGEPGIQELRCKRCRTVLANQRFIIPHQKAAPGKQPCPHHFIEALSWMRPLLEGGELDGRLVCPNAKCGSSIGRYSWQGFKCSCGEWVCPAFSLGASKVDEVATRRPPGPAGAAAGSVGDPRARAAAMGIRMPPGKQNL